MTEQKIEQIVIDRISAALDGAGLRSYQMIGSWQAASPARLKAYEEDDAENVVCVKVLPRQYDVATVPYAVFTVQLTVLSRADVDGSGAKWLAATEIVQGVLQRWQLRYSSVEEDFAVEGEFEPSGFNTTGGDTRTDKDGCVWQFTQSFDLYGVINS